MTQFVIETNGTVSLEKVAETIENCGWRANVRQIIERDKDLETEDQKLKAIKALVERPGKKNSLTAIQVLMILNGLNPDEIQHLPRRLRIQNHDA